MKRFSVLAVCLALSGCVSMSAWVRHPETGRVVDAENGQPIANARVSTQEGEFLAMTGPDGVFKVPAKKGKVTVFLLAANDIVERTVLVVSADNYEVLTYALPFGFVVRGDAEPVAGQVGDIKIKRIPNHSPEPMPSAVR
jgi:hypothetical protein